MAAQYPSAAGTDANLFVAVNNLSCTLTDNPLSSGAVTVNVNSTTGFPTAGYITIDAEAISYTGTTGTSFTGCTRGADGTTAVTHLVGSSVLHDVVAAHHNTLKDEIKAIETDLVGLQASITPVSATNTATSALNRLAMLVNQIKVGFGLTNWYDAIASAMMPKSGGTFTGAITLGANSPAAGFKWTGLGAGSANGDSVRFEQLNLNAAGYMKGTVVATVIGNSTTAFSTTSGTYQTTNLTATITPKATTHKIRVTVSGEVLTPNTAACDVALSIFRDSTDTAPDAGFGLCYAGDGGTASGVSFPATAVVLDSPASTSAIVYSAKIKVGAGSGTIKFGNHGEQYILIEEIAF